VVSKEKKMSFKKPEICCDFGSCECFIPMPLNGRVHDIDYCIADIVAALNAGGIVTIASCCGHGKTDGIISLEDGRELLIKMNENKNCESLDKVEENSIRNVLDITNGNRREASKRLKIGERTLYRKIKKYGIQSGKSNDKRQKSQIAD
jgi:DNA-binding NtrC family response regulator